VKKMAELTITTMHFALTGLEQAGQYCAHSIQFAICLFTQCLAFDIADITEDYNDSIVFLNCELSAPLMLPVEAIYGGNGVHTLCFTQLNHSEIDWSLGSVQCGGLCQVEVSFTV
jgi:hypothetical protein